ncbi:hypothetical protein GCM10010988_40130 [Cnuibacter physcomitrellae]|nr:hypothetical protein GCM10010988_40130 [Cnuibacter physcomitrellae]
MLSRKVGIETVRLSGGEMFETCPMGGESDSGSPTRRPAFQIQNLNAPRFDRMTRQRYQGGRQSKGDRRAIISRVPVPLGDAVSLAAHQRGMSVNDFVASVLAREVGMADLAPQTPLLPLQEELPISA